MNQPTFLQKLTGSFFLFTVLFGHCVVFAQTRSGLNQSANGKTKSDSQKCNSGYTGSIKYTKTVTTSTSGNFGSRSDMKRVYRANLVIRDDGRQSIIANALPGIGINGSLNLTAQAEAAETENYEDIRNTEGEDFCKLTLAGAKDKRQYKCTSSLKRNSNAQGTGTSDVFIGLRGRNLHLSISDLPKLNGQSATASHSSCSGTCSPRPPINDTKSGTITNGGEKTASTDENSITFDPENFNRLAGSWTRTSDDGASVETFEWNLSRCAPPLEVAEIDFQHKRVPDPNTWYGIDPLSGTIDGNLVKIKAKVFNNGGETAYADVKFSELKSGEQLPNGTVSVAIKPGEARDVEYEWDTSGFAWNENQKAESTREIKVEIDGDTKTEKIKILPKPVVLVHGLWSNAAAWADWHAYLREAHSFAWNAFPVGERPEIAKMSTGDHPGNYKPTNTVFQNSQEVAKQIKFVREQKNAWHVDVVAHSMGGLISRHYINTFMMPVFDGRPEVTHLVMLGTPNMGSPCADLVGNIFEFFEQNDMNAMRELRPSVVAEFNRTVTNRKGVKFSILIGYAVPQTCQSTERGDGVVPIPSARFNITDREYVFRDHISLTDDVNFRRFVLPRIAVGPKKSKNEQTIAWLEDDRQNDPAFSADEKTENDRYGFNRYFQKVSYKREGKRGRKISEAENLKTRERLKLQPKETREIEIPADEADSIGVILIGTAAVAGTVKDADGKIIGEIKGGLDAYKNPFRVLNFDNEAKNSVYKLKLENLGGEEENVFVGAWAENKNTSRFTVEAGKPGANGTITLQAKLSENGSPVLNARITAEIVGQTNEITFFDDGKHGDAAANDGIYGAMVGKPGKGEYYIEARAETGGQTLLAIVVIGDGQTESKSVKPVVKPGRRK